MARGFLVFLGMFAIVFAVAIGAVWIFIETRNDRVFEQVRGWAQIAQPILTFATVLVAAFVAYQTFLTPFSPRVIARPYTWRMGPATPESRSLDVAIWLTISNRGAMSGSLDDLAVRITLPKGSWILEPRFFARSAEYYQTFWGVNFNALPAEGLFTPIFLPGKSQTTRVVVFGPAGVQDFDPTFTEPGVHRLTLYARYNGGKFEKVTTQNLIFVKDDLERWATGETIAGQVVERDKPTRELLPK